ncbi:MAG: thioesterase [Proteobacteria bacterium]|nr:MAG: thioesterase [Pseudomonadota bacterium]QKK11442.1 MAG: thioesterase family protein [Pseudomonadota bacterium]
MNLIFRFLRVLFRALLKPRIGVLDTSEVNFRVWPTDLDINRHMTNARYLSMMDLGRTDLLIRAGMLGTVMQERWLPVVGNINIRFRRSLDPFQRFTMKTRLLCWDEKWFYMEQRIESSKGVHSVATVRGLFRGRGGSVPTEKLLERMDYRQDSPAFPPEVTQWVECESASY